MLLSGDRLRAIFRLVPRFECGNFSALVIVCVMFLSFNVQANPNDQADANSMLLGRKVLAVKAALADPTAQDSLQAVRDLGLDSRHYVMVRGWLDMQLRGDRSIAKASQGQVSPEISQRIEFLEKAIRAIDLE